MHFTELRLTKITEVKLVLRVLEAARATLDLGGLRAFARRVFEKMDLIGLPENPVPQGAITVPILAQDGLTLRAARWAGSAPRGTVVILLGRGEFIENYFEVVEELLTRRFDVVIMDWRGQGLSERELADPRKGPIDDFLI